MKIITIFAFALYTSLVFSQNNYFACHQDSMTGNTIYEFDWRVQKYEFYMSGRTGADYITSPFWPSLDPQENVDFLTDFPQDFEPSDGWELVLKHFGTSDSSRVPTPTLVLYNRYNGVMRVFQYAKNDIQTYQSAVLEVQPYINGTSFSKESSLFGHMNTPMAALDGFEKGIIIDFPNKYYNYTQGSAERTWLMGDFVTAYDPCVCSHTSGVRLQPRFVQLTTIDLELAGTGTASTQQVYEQNTGTSNSKFASAIRSAGNVVSALAQGGKSFKELGYFNDFVDSLSLPSSLVPSFVDGFLDEIPLVGTAVKFLDLIVGDDKKISSFHSKFHFDVTGTGNLQKEDVANPTRFKTPGAISPAIPDIEGVKVIYDNPLGIMNLLKTPEVWVVADGLPPPYPSGTSGVT
jgi:hypothetical protein